MADARSIVWVDAGGRTRQTILRGIDSLIGGATLASVQADVLAISNAGVQEYWQGTDTFPAGTGTAAVYPNVSDWAQLLFTAVDGSIVYVTIPAPASSIFLADGETVDSSMITTLIADAIACLVTNTGAHPTAYAGGVRRSRLKEYQ